VLAGFIVLLVSSMLVTAVTAYFLHQKMQEDPGKWTWLSIWWEATFRNIFALVKDRVEPTIKYIPDIWAYLIKGLIPQLSIIPFVNSAATENKNDQSIFFHYGNYAEMPFQVMGVVIVAFTAVLFLVGFFIPQIYAPLATSYTRARIRRKPSIMSLAKKWLSLRPSMSKNFLSRPSMKRPLPPTTELRYLLEELYPAIVSMRTCLSHLLGAGTSRLYYLCFLSLLPTSSLLKSYSDKCFLAWFVDSPEFWFFCTVSFYGSKSRNHATVSSRHLSQFEIH
jgi:hypothetical protein